ncbi:MAG: hypothetical protein RL571_1107 [Pseudomonadota bacterium]|jgi:methyl-accepting chemotaxis protein
MEWLKQAHTTLERELIPSLARKFSFILLFVFFPLILLIASYSAASRMATLCQQLHLNNTVSNQLQNIISPLQTLA